MNDELDFVFAPDERIQRSFRCRLREVAAEFREQGSFLRPRRRRFFTGRARQLFPQRGKPEAAFHQDFRAEALFFAQDAEEQMLGADVLMTEALRFFRRHVKDALALRAERHFDGRRDALADGDAGFDLFAYGFDRALLPQETIGQGLVLEHQAEQQMLRLDVRTAILAGFVPREKYDASRLLCITFEHVSSLLPLGARSPRPQPREFAERRAPAPVSGHTARRATGYASRSATSTCVCGAAVPATRTQPKHSARPDLP